MKRLLLLLLFPFRALAEVVSTSENGFTIQIEREVAVSQQTAYRQFIKISEWWLDDHTYFGSSKNLSIASKVGGCFCEINGKNQVLHMTVSYIEPSKEIRMIGGLGPLQMMAANGGMSWQFIALDKQRTKIIQRYQVSGSNGLDKLAAIVDKVQTMQHESLVKRISE